MESSSLALLAVGIVANPAEVLAFGIITSAAAIVAAVSDRFRKGVPTCLAVVAGILPWFCVAMVQGWIQTWGLDVFWAIAIFGSAPLFLVAFFLFGVGKRTPRRGVAAGASLVGMFAGIGFSMFLAALLGQGE